MLAAIDLHGCERGRLEDPGTLRRFVPSLINAIGMRALARSCWTGSVMVS